MLSISFLKTLGAISSVTKKGEFAIVKLTDWASISQFINLWLIITSQEDLLHCNTLVGHLLNCDPEASLTKILVQARSTRLFKIPLSDQNATSLEIFYVDKRLGKQSLIFNLT